jgi:hypothetical protein
LSVFPGPSTVPHVQRALARDKVPNGILVFPDDIASIAQRISAAIIDVKFPNQREEDPPIELRPAALRIGSDIQRLLGKYLPRFLIRVLLRPELREALKRGWPAILAIVFKLREMNVELDVLEVISQPIGPTRYIREMNKMMLIILPIVSAACLPLIHSQESGPRRASIGFQRPRKQEGRLILPGFPR